MDTKVTCLGAHTLATGAGYPPYINASLHGDDTVAVIVRGPSHPDNEGYIVSGNEAMIHMPVTEFKRWLGECVSELIIANAKCDESTRAIIRKAITSAIDTDPAKMPARTFVLPPPSQLPWDAYHNRFYEPVEERAQRIYATFTYDGPGNKPTWVQHGNSTRQDDARELARAELQLAGHTGEVASGQCKSGESFPQGNCEG